MEYADDTLLLAVTKPHPESILQVVQVEATLYMLHLDKTKTELLKTAHNTDVRITHVEGNPVTEVDEFKYLGSLISSKHTASVAIQDRDIKTHVA